MGAHALRDGALDDQETVEWIRERFVPIWVNIRRDPVPDLPDLEAIAVGATIHPETRRVKDVGSKGFFLRVLALDPRDLRLLNPQEDHVAGSMSKMVRDGSFSYAQVKPKGVRRVLEASLDAYAGRDPTAMVETVVDPPHSESVTP